MKFDPTKVVRHRVVLLVGDEELLRRRALRQVLDAAEVAPDDFDLETFDGGESGPDAWAASVGTAPFLAPRRVAIVRHLLRCETDRLKGVDLSALPESALLILVADDEAGSEDRIQRLRTTVRKGWEKAVATAGGHVAAFDPDPKAARDGIKREAIALGKSMSDRAAETLAEMTGGSLSRAMDELQKLALYVGDAEGIREADVRTVVVPSREWNVFRMTDAIVAGDVAEALRQLRTLVGSSGKPEEAAFRSVLPQLSRSLRLLWQARVCVEARCGPSNAPERVLATFPDKPNLAKEPPYRQNAVMNGARKVSLPQLTRCLQVLADTDARLKGSLEAFSALETLERMVLEMAAAVAPVRA